MSFDDKYGHLHSNQKLLIRELLQRGISVEVLDSGLELIRATYLQHQELILDRDSSIVPYSVSVLAGDKMLTKKFLKTVGLSVPIGQAFNIKDEAFIIKAFHLFQSGVVLKPTFGSHGEDVYINLESEDEVIKAIDKIRKNRGQHTTVIIEEFFDAKEYRVFVTKNGDYAVLNREPAYVIGNGEATIQELIKIENEKRLDRKKTSLCPIVIDESSLKLLGRKGIKLKDTPDKGKKVTLRYNSNIATGGVSSDYTDLAHPTVIENCLKVFEAFPGLPYAGVDYMVNDITQKQKPQDYRILEVNTNPGLHMHMTPAFGNPRNISRVIVDMIFPETAQKHDNAKRKLKKI